MQCVWPFVLNEPYFLIKYKSGKNAFEFIILKAILVKMKDSLISVSMRSNLGTMAVLIQIILDTLVKSKIKLLLLIRHKRMVR